MTPEGFARAFLESGADERRSLLDQPDVVGKNRAVFELAASLIGENPSLARALSSTWDLLLEKGDDPAFAYRLGGVHSRLGARWQEAAVLFEKAGKAAVNPLDKLTFAVGGVDSLARSGQPHAAEKLGAKLAKGLEKLGRPDLAGRAWLNAGNAALWADEHRRARRLLSRARERLEGTGFQVEHAGATIGLSSAALFIDRPITAYELSRQAGEELAELGSKHFASLCEVNSGQALVQMGRIDEALRLFISLRDSLEPDSWEFTRLCQFCGDASLHLTLLPEAETFYQDCLDSPGAASAPLTRANALAGLGHTALLEGRHSEARTLFQEARELYLDCGSENFASMTLAWEGRAECLAGNLAGATSLLEQAVVALREARIGFELAEAFLDLASCVPPDRALEPIREAQSLISRRGYRSLGWRVHAALAQIQPSERSAIIEYRRMIKSLAGYRAHLSSTAGRTSMVDRVEPHARRYLGLLLDIGSPSVVREALSVLQMLRSSVLIDEIVSASPDTLGREGLAVLADLRESLAEPSGQRDQDGPLRRTFASRPMPKELTQRYFEAISLTPLASAAEDQPKRQGKAANCLLLVDKGAAWLSDRGVQYTGLQEPEIQSLLRWIWFDLLASECADREALQSLKGRLRALSQKLKIGSLESLGGVIPISPEGIGFGVPWTLVIEEEPLICLRPGPVVDPGKIVLPPNPKTAIWYHGVERFPHMKNEVERFLSQFPNATVCTTSADVRESAASGPYDLVHIAAHGVFHKSNPMFSSLELEDGLLTAAEISASGVRARLAVIGSCDSGALHSPLGWEPQGLVRAFLSRGCEAVVGSLWPLDDRAAMTAFTRLYEELLAGANLSDAMRAGRNLAKMSNYHPGFWGSIVMFGGVGA